MELMFSMKILVKDIASKGVKAIHPPLHIIHGEKLLVEGKTSTFTELRGTG